MEIVESRHSPRSDEVIFNVIGVTRQKLLDSNACDGCALIAICSSITNGDPYIRYPANKRTRSTETELKAQANCKNL